MSKKHHEKQVARARARRAEERAQQRGRRRMIIAGAVLVVAVAAGITWLALAGGDDEPDPVATETPQPDEPTEPGETSQPTETTTEAVDAPCPPPTDAPTPDTSMQWDTPPPADLAGTVTATIETTCGTIVAELDADAAPQAVSNFAFLAEQGYYAGTPFHRVMADFVIQGGDPTGTGTGGPGYSIEDELEVAEQVVGDNDGNYPRGTLAMANSGPDSAGSQFFVVQADPGYPFQPDYTVFGTVTDGMDVVDDIANGPVTGERNDQAVDPAVITNVVVETP